MRASQVLKVFTVLAVLSVSSTALISAQKPFAGTWKLNAAKSKFTTDSGIKEMTEIFEAVGDQWKYVGMGTDSDGNPINEHFIMAFDGKDHAVDEPGTTIAVTEVDDYTLNVTIKNYGKVVASDHTVVSKDGKTMTTSKDDETVLVFEKAISLAVTKFSNVLSFIWTNNGHYGQVLTADRSPRFCSER